MDRSYAFEAPAEAFRVLGHPVRLQVLAVLKDECQPVTAIVAALGLAQPLVSHHLRLLKERGLARSQRQGSFTYY